MKFQFRGLHNEERGDGGPGKFKLFDGGASYNRLEQRIPYLSYTKWEEVAATVESIEGTHQLPGMPP